MLSWCMLCNHVYFYVISMMLLLVTTFVSCKHALCILHFIFCLVDSNYLCFCVCPFLDTASCYFCFFWLQIKVTSKRPLTSASCVTFHPAPLTPATISHLSPPICAHVYSNLVHLVSKRNYKNKSVEKEAQCLVSYVIFSLVGGDSISRNNNTGKYRVDADNK